MNSAEELSKYQEVGGEQYNSPTLNRRYVGYGYDFPEKSPKKEKKWSIGSFFRRRKKEDSADSGSSEEDLNQQQQNKRSFLNRKKHQKKSEKKKKGLKQTAPSGFDHVVLSRNSHLYTNGYNAYLSQHHDDHGILSDPSGGFNSYNSSRVLPKSQENLSALRTTTIPKSMVVLRNSHENLETGSVDSLTPSKKAKKGLAAKVRAEARRVNNLRRDSSSDDDSQQSAASSSRFQRSDENLGNTAGSRRSRAARTERYLRRHSRDGENPNNYLRISKSDAENTSTSLMGILQQQHNWKTSDDSNRSQSRSPLVPKNKVKTSYSSLSSQSISGMSTIPPPSHGSHSNNSRIRVSNSTSNPSYKPPLSMNDYNNSSGSNSRNKLLLPMNSDGYFNSNQRSVSCDANIHKSPTLMMDVTSSKVVNKNADNDVLHVQFPLGKPNNHNTRYRNLSLIDTRLISSMQSRQPPPPPPRDPRRLLVNAQYYDNNNARPNSFYYDGGGGNSIKTQTSQQSVLSLSPTTNRKKHNLLYNLRSGRSTSEDCLPKSNNANQQSTIQRPSSATPDANASRKLFQRQELKGDSAENYNYLTEKKPRSRKPIFIQSSANATSKSVDDSNNENPTKKAIDFWKQKDREGQSNTVPAKRNSPQMFTCQTHVQTQVFLPSVLQNDINNDHLKANSVESLTVNNENANNFQLNDEIDGTADEIKHKSTNLEEALDELEAIYNSLRLGDEDLLERAEQREKEMQEEKIREKRPDIYWMAMSGRANSGALSDSSFSYEPFDSVDSPRRRRLMKKSQTVDRRADDMAFRKLNKDQRSQTINDPQSVIAKVSYLQASPLYGQETSNDFDTPEPNAEIPDVQLDDVVYRNIKFANIVPKVVETQPPFGIPLGPITKAANSDYLHAVPDNNGRPLFKPRKVPDIVMDDLAYRNLRKDISKEAALPPSSADDLKNNNIGSVGENTKFEMKKKRAVRSLSANIGSLINKDVLARGLERYKENNNSYNEFNDLSNIADAMEIARQVLKEKEQKINATRHGFLSDNDTTTTSNTNNEMKESRMNFLNSLKDNTNQQKATSSLSCLNTKPPHGLACERKSPRTTKESTPIPHDLEDRKNTNLDRSHDSSLDDLLTALATEARETSDRISNELKQFSESLKIDDNVTKQLSDIESVSEQAKICEKLLEGVEEQVEQIVDEPVVMESVANIVLTRDDEVDKDDEVVTKTVACDPESDHDYENLKSDEELNLNILLDKCEISDRKKMECASPFEERKAELIASFQELKNNVGEIDVAPSTSGKNMEKQEKNKFSEDDDDQDAEEEKLVTGKHSTTTRRSRSRLPRWLRPHSCGNLSDPTTILTSHSKMSAEHHHQEENASSRAERIARYKDERRKELAAQFHKNQNSPTSLSNNKRNNVGNSRDGSSSSDQGPRTTRASRLRAAATTNNTQQQEIQSSPLVSNNTTKLRTNEKMLSSSSSPETSAFVRRNIERDKSSKRKSNLNRSLNSEEVVPLDLDDAKSRRRRHRRFFPPEVLESDSSTLTPTGTTSCFSSNVSPITTTSTATTAALSTSSSSSSPRLPTTPTHHHHNRKSELSVHMENARKMLTPSYCEMGSKAKSNQPSGATNVRRSVTSSSPKLNSKGCSSLDMDNNSQSDRDVSYKYTKDNIKSSGSIRIRDDSKVTIRKNSNFLNNNSKKTGGGSDNEGASLAAATSKQNIAKKLDEITAFTKETLARVELLASRSKESPRLARKQVPPPPILPPAAASSPVRQIGGVSSSNRRKSGSIDRASPSSILKRTSFDENGVVVDQSSISVVMTSSPAATASSTTAPVSILKRKISQDEHNKNSDIISSTPPVTFSPSVVEPATTNRRQGILKKRRSLDESQVMRHRSCSPNKQSSTSDSPSILKNQRRSSLEELTRTESPEPHLHGILKRKTSRSEDDDHSLNSPQSILKRRSGASSAGSTGSTPHVSITTAVILAAAGGAEMVLEEESLDNVRPILKKKSISEEYSFNENGHYYQSDVPKPILKKKSSTDTDDGDDHYHCQRARKPILKITRPFYERDLFETNDSNNIQQQQQQISETMNDCDSVRPILKQNTVKEDFSTTTTTVRPRLSFSHDRDEVKIRQTSRRSHTICADFNLPQQQTTNLDKKDEDRQLKKPRPLSVLELVMNFENTSSVPSKGAIPKRQSLPNKRHGDRYRTQPVTSNELEASLNLVRSPHPLKSSLSPSSAAALTTTSAKNASSSLLDFTSSFENDSDLNGYLIGSNTSPSHYTPTSPSETGGKMSSDSAFQSLGDGLELDQDDEHDNSKLESTPTCQQTGRKLEMNKLDLQMKAIAEEAKSFRLGKGLTKYSNRKSTGSNANRFSTQPVTFEEVQEASKLKPSSEDTGDRNERRGILKSPSGINVQNSGGKSIGGGKSVLKKRDSFKIDVADEGISCNDSASDSETAAPSVVKCSEGIKSKKVLSTNGDTTSDGESSGGREVRSIFRNENKLKLKNQLESVLSKSKSQIVVTGDDSDGIIGSSSCGKKSAIRRSQTQSAMPRSIAEIQAELQQSGETGWKKRINNKNDDLLLLKDKNRYNDERSTLLAARKDELDASAQNWRNRVEKSDAEKFSSVPTQIGATVNLNIPIGDNNKRTSPTARSKLKEASSTPVSPEKNKLQQNRDLSRSYSVPDPEHDSSGSDSSSLSSFGRKVAILRPDDDTFTSFFTSTTTTTTKESLFDLTQNDLDCIPRTSLLVQKKNVHVQRKRNHITSKNPIKALAHRSDIILHEYTEVLTGVAEREKKRLNIERLAKGASLSAEALAALAKKEDFAAVELKKSTFVSDMAPFKDIMLLQIKGRRHVEMRLVEPKAESINEGDNFILITASKLYSYSGAYANVIEQSRMADILNHIQQSGELGCKSAEIVSIDAKKREETTKTKRFWEILGCDPNHTFANFGHQDEDEAYEKNIRATNMIYEVNDDDELQAMEELCGLAPKYDLLQPDRVFVFDFGSEMYVWSGKNAASNQKKLALKKAKELWDNGFDYSNKDVNPLNVAVLLGNRAAVDVEMKGNKRPLWALFARITQHRETILFKEKFLDWPDFSRIIRVRTDNGNNNNNNEKNVDPSYQNITACNVEEMLKTLNCGPDLVVEGIHLGRGKEYFDKETNRLFEFETQDISMWCIFENTYEAIKNKSIGHFYNGDSYIIRWNYRMTVRGRELSGKPSKHIQSGRDRTIYFYWQGAKSSINEKGYAALMTVEIDKENAPQIRVSEGYEPAAFLRLFNGNMVVHMGKIDENNEKIGSEARMFYIRGELANETCLIEVPCNAKQLRSRTSFIIVDDNVIRVWHGAKSCNQTRKLIKESVNRLIGDLPIEFGLDNYETDDLEVIEFEEGKESAAFWKVLNGSKKDDYVSLRESVEKFDFTMKMFYLSSISGTFEGTEILCPYRSDSPSPYPFLQSELYSASQPALFLIDNHYELWLWQGWWPEGELAGELSDQTGSGAVRWQQERKAAMKTALDYWKKTHSTADSNKEGESVPAYLVWAGLEPLEFKNLFPDWIEHDDVKQLNLNDGRTENGKLSVDKELLRLSRSTYPLEELLKRPLPEGVDPTQLEIYLSPDDFQKVLSMSKEEFHKMPLWKQTSMKKERGLF